ncbi:hypothetical protein DRQ32_12545, partial [bacterium]
EEIAYVRYYKPDGTLLHEERSGSRDPGTPRLSATELSLLSGSTRSDSAYQLDAGGDNGDEYRVSASLWAESIVADGLIGFDPSAGGQEEAILLGFVELGLDFSSFRASMNRRVVQWSLGILLSVFVLTVIGLVGIRRALRPLHDLREPLSNLAAGNLDLPVDEAEHSELAAINDALASTISALHQRDRDIREAANFDALTGLMGRVGLTERLKSEIASARKNGGVSAVLFLDLDQFKYVNDTVGHGAGDRLLIRVADLFRSLSNEEDLICRYGGDEFILVRHGTSLDAAEQFAARIVESMADIQFVEDGRAFNVRCSIGLTMVDANSDKPEDLIAQADLACHEAKGLGRNRYQVFTRDRGEREQIAADMGWSDRIREALDSGGLSLRYQPIVRIEDNDESIYEVLLRMKGEGRSVIPPGAFLPAANRFGLTGDLDFWVIRTAFEKLAKIRRKRPDVVFSLNLSGIVFSEPRMIDYVAEQLEASGLPGSAIIFEVTEQVAIRHIEDANTIMRALIDFGCRFALDDFGSGFSSFNYLKQLPVSFLKIDGAFIENLARDEADRAIVTAIAQIAVAVGTKTIAEHVPDEPTLKILEEIGVDFAQGYYIGRPARKIRMTPVPVA